MNTFNDFADKFFGNGYIPIPVNTHKKPFPAGWQTTTRENFEERFKEWSEDFASAQIGILCGEPSGIVVLDLDLDERDPVQAYIYQQIKELLPASLVRQVSRKGIKLFFKYNGEQTQSFHIKINGIHTNIFDLLSDGRQIVVPPSFQETNGETYHYKDIGQPLIDTQPSDLPDLDLSLIEKIKSVCKFIETNQSFPKQNDQAATTGRNHAMVSQVTIALKKGKDVKTIVKEITWFDKQYHQPPLFEDDRPGDKIKGHNGDETPKGRAETLIRNVAKTLKINPDQQPGGIPPAFPIPDTNWGDPLDLFKIETPPSMTEDLIPNELKSWLIPAAKNLGVPYEMIAVPAIVGIGSLIGRKITLKPRPKSNYEVPANLWGVLIARPGLKKSPSMDEGLRFLREFEIEELKNWESIRYECEALKAAHESKISSIKSKLNDANKGGSDVKIHQKEYAEEMIKFNEQLPKQKRHIVNDSTVEKLQLILSENPNGVLIQRDELIGLLDSFKRSGREADRPFYLEGWNATGNPYNIDRVSRGTTVVKSVILSIIANIQPGVLRSFIEDSIQASRGADGLIQRFQLMVCPNEECFTDGAGYDSEEPEFDKARLVFTRIKNFSKASFGFYEGHKNGFLRFDAQAQREYMDYCRKLSALLKKGQDDYILSHFSKYEALLAKLCIAFHLIKCGGSGDYPEQIDSETLKLAAQWVRFMKVHAEYVYNIPKNEETIGAQELARHILNGDIKTGIRLRQIHERGWKLLSTPKMVEQACNVLVDKNWIKLELANNAGRGGKKSFFVILNPVIEVRSMTRNPESQ